MVSTTPALPPQPTNIANLVAKIRDPWNLNVDELRAVLTTLAFALQETRQTSDNVLAHQVLTSITLPELFALFAHPDDGILESAAVVIERTLEPLPFERILDDAKDYIQQGLQHPSSAVRNLTLKQMQKGLQSEEDIERMLASSLLFPITDCLRFSDVTVSTRTIVLLTELCQQEVGLKAFLSQKEALETLMNDSSVVRLRLFDLTAQLSKLSDMAFQLCEASGVLDQLMAASTNTDLLMRLNVVELFNVLAESEPGFEYLINRGVLDTFSADMASLGEDLENESGSSRDVGLELLQCAEMKFYGNIAGLQYVNFVALDERYHIFRQVEGALNSSSRDIKNTAIAVIGTFGSTLQGLSLLVTETESGGYHHHSLIERFLNLYQTGSVDDRIEVLRSMCEILTVGILTGKSNDMTDGDATGLGRIRSVFDGIEGQSGTSLQKVVSECRQPFQQLRVAAYAVLRNLVNHRWGREEMAKSRDTINFLLNRTTDGSQTGKEWKYAIVQALAGAEDSRQVFGDITAARLQRYVNEGPFYIATEAGVMVDVQI